MKKNKLFRITIGLLMISMMVIPVFGPSIVGAADIVSDVCSQPTATGEAPSVCNDNLAGSDNNPITGPEGIATKGVQLFVFALAVTAIIVLMINAVRMITANGDANSVNSARNGILYAVIGLVIAMSGQVIVTFILSKL